MKNLGKYGKWVLVGIFAIVFFLNVSGCVGGIGAGDIVVSRIPAEVQQPVYVEAVDDKTGEAVRVRISEGLPATMSHNDSQAEFLRWSEQQLRIAERWEGNLQDSAKWTGFVDALGALGLEAIDDAIPGLGAFAIPAAGLLGMFGFKRPGDVSKDEVTAKSAELEARWRETLSDEKRDSYNKGYKVANHTYEALLKTLKENNIDIEKLPKIDTT